MGKGDLHISQAAGFKEKNARETCRRSVWVPCLWHNLSLCPESQKTDILLKAFGFVSLWAAERVKSKMGTLGPVLIVVWAGEDTRFKWCKEPSKLLHHPALPFFPCKIMEGPGDLHDFFKLPIHLGRTS